MTYEFSLSVSRKIPLNNSIYLRLHATTCGAWAFSRAIKMKTNFLLFKGEYLWVLFPANYLRSVKLNCDEKLFSSLIESCCACCVYFVPAFPLSIRAYNFDRLRSIRLWNSRWCSIDRYRRNIKNAFSFFLPSENNFFMVAIFFITFLIVVGGGGPCGDRINCWAKITKEFIRLKKAHGMEKSFWGWERESIMAR